MKLFYDLKLQFPPT